MNSSYLGSMLALAITLAVPRAAGAGQGDILPDGTAPAPAAPTSLGGCPAWRGR